MIPPTRLTHKRASLFDDVGFMQSLEIPKIANAIANDSGASFKSNVPELRKQHIEAVNAPCISANVLYNDKLLGPEYVVKNIQGKKLVFLHRKNKF